MYLKIMNVVETFRVLTLSRSHMPPVIHCLCRNFFFFNRAIHHLKSSFCARAQRYHICIHTGHSLRSFIHTAVKYLWPAYLSKFRNQKLCRRIKTGTNLVRKRGEEGGFFAVELALGLGSPGEGINRKEALMTTPRTRAAAAATTTTKNSNNDKNDT